MATIDITNDSSIVGLAMQIPSSGVVVWKIKIKSTPGSGEALLRGQLNLVPSSISLLLPWDSSLRLRPTPPQVIDGVQIVIPSPVVSGQLRAAAASSQAIVTVGLVESSCYAKTQVATGEYCGLRWSREPDEVEVVMSGISKLLVSQFTNLQSGSQNKTIDVCL
ncbi:hypothetical protein Rs2_46807 [Raphanus sativus]|nr:hypothetical protein Rs2_46807 [Raphanus sativus]